MKRLFSSRRSSSNPQFFDALESRTLMAAIGPETTIFEGEKNVQAVVKGDFDGDGAADIVMARATELSFLKNLGNGEYAEPSTIRLNANIGNLYKGRFNGDTLPDLASVVRLANGDFLIRVLFFDRQQGKFTTGPRFVLPANPQAVVGITAIDLTGDVRSEIVVSDGTSLRLLTLPNKTRIVDAGIIFNAPQNWGIGNLVTSAGDYDSNGRTDLFLRNRTPTSFTTNAFLLKRTPNSVGVNVSSATDIPLRSGMDLLDLNGDGVKDLTWLSNDQLMIAYGTGNAQFADAVSVAQFGGDRPMYSIRSAFHSGTADFNGDGLEDVVVGYSQQSPDRDVDPIYDDLYVAIQPTEPNGEWTIRRLDSVESSVSDGFYSDRRYWTPVYTAPNTPASILRVNRKSIDLIRTVSDDVAPQLYKVEFPAGLPRPLGHPVTVVFHWTGGNEIGGDNHVSALRLYRDTNNNGVVDSGDLRIIPSAASSPGPFTRYGPSYRYDLYTADFGPAGTFKLIGQIDWWHASLGTGTSTLLLPGTYTI